jgi:aerobic-type carbon monoxide dehydrogenase small subunit (CoxS/CutS family)
MATIDVTVNGERDRVDVPDHWTLMDLLRDRLELTGPKDGCSEGVCGACSVWLDGRLVRACLALARRVDGREVATVEGLDAHGMMSGLQRAFVEHGAIQCAHRHAPGRDAGPPGHPRRPPAWPPSHSRNHSRRASPTASSCCARRRRSGPT